MKRNEDNRHLEHKRKVDEDRRARAIEKRKQETLRNITPGVATPASVKRHVDTNALRKRLGG